MALGLPSRQVLLVFTRSQLLLSFRELTSLPAWKTAHTAGSVQKLMMLGPSLPT